MNAFIVLKSILLRRLLWRWQKQFQQISTRQRWFWAMTILDCILIQIIILIIVPTYNTVLRQNLNLTLLFKFNTDDCICL